MVVQRLTVDIDRYLDRTVPHPPLDIVIIDALLTEDAAVGMPQVVKTKLPDLRGFDGRIKGHVKPSGLLGFGLFVVVVFFFSGRDPATNVVGIDGTTARSSKNQTGSARNHDRE